MLKAIIGHRREELVILCGLFFQKSTDFSVHQWKNNNLQNKWAKSPKMKH